MRRGRIEWRVSGFESGEGVGRITVNDAEYNVTQCSTSLLLVINLLIVCPPALGCFCGVCDIDLSIPLRFTCPICTPRTGPSPHTHPLSQLTMSENIQIHKRSHRHLTSHPTQSLEASHAPYHRPTRLLPTRVPTYLLRAIKLTAELPRYRSPKHGSHETNSPIPKDAQGITARPGSGVSPLCKNCYGATAYRPFFRPWIVGRYL
jgi:hypothetical protein